MSTKTTFKRIALVAVAALGLGVLSVAPSSAATSSLVLTASAGSAGATAGTVADTTTAGTVLVTALTTDAADTISVSMIRKSAPSSGAARTAHLGFVETATVSTAVGSLVTTVSGMGYAAVYDSKTGVSTTASDAYVISGAVGYKSAKFSVVLDTATVPAAGDYVYTIVASVYSPAGAYVSQTLADVTITVAALATASKVASTGTSTAVLSAGSSYAPTTAGVDDVVGALATASTTAAATLRVSLLNASSGNAIESLTATITGAGVIGDGTTFGKSVVVAYTSTDQTAGYKDLSIRPDGSAGTATVNVSSTSVTFAPKTINFYAKSPKTITAKINNPILNVGANASAVSATAVDANGIAWTGQLYIVAVAAADALVGGSATAPVKCTWTPAKAVHYCPVTTLIAGTANLKVIDQTLDTDAAYTTADSAASSDAVVVTVSNSTPATVKLAFDKATYAPFEKAIITVTPLDSAGKTMGTKTVTNLFATGGISTNVAFGSSSDTLTAVTLTTSADNSSTAPRTAGSYTYTVYMPAQGTVTISATGGTGLAAAGQVAVSASAEVVNSSVDAATDAANEATDAANAATDAALAAADAADAATAAAQDASDAVAALSATVAKLVASLKAQITSLTNLVIKIQKKVRA